MEFLFNILKQTLSIALSIGLLGFIGYLLRAYIKRYIDHYFKELESDSNYKKSIDIEILKNYFPIYGELDELVYKTRNYARDIVEQNSPLIESRERYSECCYLFTERLSRYRAYLNEEIFKLLHRYKRFIQDFLLIIDVSDRFEEIRKNKLIFSDENKSKLNALYREIDLLYFKITTYFQKEMHIK